MYLSPLEGMLGGVKSWHSKGGSSRGGGGGGGGGGSHGLLPD